jgi:hypothetical protein
MDARKKKPSSDNSHLLPDTSLPPSSFTWYNFSIITKPHSQLKFLNCPVNHILLHIPAAARAAAYRRELRNLMKHIESYTVILLMPYLYENGTAEAWQKLIEELGPMGYSVQDEESLELHSSLASEVRIILTISLNVLSNNILYG